MFGANPSPEGRGWPEGPGEGYKDSCLHPSPAASRHPLPSGEGFAPNIFQSGQHHLNNPLERQSKLALE
jgi:hypothetical protein